VKQQSRILGGDLATRHHDKTLLNLSFGSRAASTRRLAGLGLALVLVFLCVPVFIGLGGLDLENDEAIYSFAVDRILETGDWLTPKSSPNDDWAFLEKPPLKMWIVAAPIKLGLLPHNEFGLRFWDALFGALVFVYTFLVATRLANPFAGVVAALILFVHRPLLLYHGFRTNNMEAALSLCYAGGMYHFLAWSTAAGAARRWWHVLAVGLYFVLGFLTKFVAALFLPLLLVAALALFHRYRTAFARDWPLWTVSGLVALLLIVPWFVYGHITYGAFFWETIFGQAIYRRFTTFLDPSHLRPWSFYLVELHEWLRLSGTVVLVSTGVVFLLVRATVRRDADAAVVLLWFALPIALISLGTSKLYHYAYPFLPPLAIAGGCVMAAATPIVERWIMARAAAVSDRKARWRGFRALSLTIAATAFIVALVTVLSGPILIQMGSTVLFKNGSLPRPLLIGVLFAILGGWPQVGARALITVIILRVLPLPAYRDMIPLLAAQDHGIRYTAECVAAIEQQQRARGAADAVVSGVYVDATSDDISHPQNYYLRRLRPWTRSTPPSPEAVATYLYQPEFQRPVLIAEPRYQELVARGVIGGRPAGRRFGINNLMILLPGPYAACGTSLDRPAAP
jgi:4-amino-4-deoxy-L-arabinose transferase-like glycosyltransferase